MSETIVFDFVRNRVGLTAPNCDTRPVNDELALVSSGAGAQPDE